MSSRGLAAALAACLVLGASTEARAGGYDTPMLYSARQMGMGGAAVSYVNDPSAIFHNPAGLQGTKRWSVLGDVSPLFGGIRATPNKPGPAYPDVKDKESKTTIAPFFMIAGAYRLTEWMTAGFGVYPVASAGAEYEYKSLGGKTEDRTKLVFIEAAPALSFQLPGNVALGASYRMTYVDLERFQGSDTNKYLDFKMTGTNFLGFKLGAQWQPIKSVQLGLTYRHKTVTTVENDSGIALTKEFTDISTKFVLPTRFIAGARYDFDVLPLGLSSDVEYALNSQNTEAPFKGTDSKGVKTSVPNVFRWTDAWTVRLGAEYRLLDRKLPLRIGGVWDQKTSNPAYPTAFGTPPGDTYIATAGLGWDAGDWQVNAAGAYRWGDGKTTIPNDAGHDVCRFCGYSGDKTYAISLIGVYLDASVNFD